MSRQGGFTLIEVLVTMFVVAVGLLAAAGLQAMTKKINYDAVQRTAATQFAQSMVERLRGNSSQLARYATTDASAASTGANCAQTGVRCSAADLAAFDLRAWALALGGTEATVGGGGLISPTGCVTATANANLYTVTVAWRGVTGLPSEASYELNACGKGLGRYDDPGSPGTDERMRRYVSLDVFVSDPYVTP